jgi:2-phospho-L-lactate guanylyltransferase
VTTLIIPVRDFAGLTRLSGSITASARRRLVRDLASGVVQAGLAADLNVVVVSSDPEVISAMTKMGVPTWEDPGGGLSQAAGHAVDQIGQDSWIVAHGDLPLVSADDLHHVAGMLESRTVLVPSSDGGTNVIGSRGPFAFSYGVGSFHRHLASAPAALVVASPGLCVDVDLPVHLSAVPWLNTATIGR